MFDLKHTEGGSVLLLHQQPVVPCLQVNHIPRLLKSVDRCDTAVGRHTLVSLGCTGANTGERMAQGRCKCDTQRVRVNLLGCVASHYNVLHAGLPPSRLFLAAF